MPKRDDLGCETSVRREQLLLEVIGDVTVDGCSEAKDIDKVDGLVVAVSGFVNTTQCELGYDVMTVPAGRTEGEPCGGLRLRRIPAAQADRRLSNPVIRPFLRLRPPQIPRDPNSGSRRCSSRAQAYWRTVLFHGARHV